MQMLFTTGSSVSANYPVLSGPGVKGANTKLLVPWVLDLARRCNDGSRRTPAMQHCTCRALVQHTSNARACPKLLLLPAAYARAYAQCPDLRRHGWVFWLLMHELMHDART